MPSGDQNRSIDPAARDRVMDLIPPFVDALDEATKNPSLRAADELRQATDDLMRAIASIMIEVSKP
jgi:hypothetical protein